MFKQNKMNLKGKFKNNEDLRSVLRDYLAKSTDDRFLLYAEEYERDCLISIEQKKRILRAEAQIKAAEANLTEEEKQINPIPFEKELRWLENERQKSKEIFEQFLSGLTEIEKRNRETMYFRDGDPKLSVLDVGDQWCLSLRFTTHHLGKRDGCSGFDRKSSARLIELLLANTYVDEKGFAFSKNKQIFRSVELSVNEKDLLMYDWSGDGNSVAYNENFLIYTGTPYLKKADKLVSQYAFPTYQVMINDGFSITYQPRYKNKFADVQTMQTNGVEEWLFTILVRIEPSYKVFLNLFPWALVYHDKVYKMDLKFYGPGAEDVFELKCVWCCPRLVSEKLYKFQDEMAKKYPTEIIAKRSRPTQYWGYGVFHEQENE
jgi:hypothetical protein